MPTKEPIERAAIQDALKAEYPLYWTRYLRTYELRAITYSWENGTKRTRKLFETTSDERASYLDEQLKSAGAKIHERSLYTAIYTFSFSRPYVPDKELIT